MNHYQYAGFWIRGGAFVIDIIIITIVFGVPLTFIYGSQYWLGDQFFHGFWDILLNYILPFIVTIWFWLRFAGTPGKMLLKLKIVDAESGGDLSLKQSVIRYFAYIVAMVPLLMGFFWIGIDSRKQGWHDKIAGTMVIRSSCNNPVERDSSNET